MTPIKRPLRHREAVRERMREEKSTLDAKLRAALTLRRRSGPQNRGAFSPRTPRRRSNLTWDEVVAVMTPGMRRACGAPRQRLHELEVPRPSRGHAQAFENTGERRRQSVHPKVGDPHRNWIAWSRPSRRVKAGVPAPDGERPPRGTGELAGIAGESAHGARAGESSLAVSHGHGPACDAQRFRDCSVNPEIASCWTGWPPNSSTARLEHQAHRSAGSTRRAPTANVSSDA